MRTETPPIIYKPVTKHIEIHQNVAYNTLDADQRQIIKHMHLQRPIYPHYTPARYQAAAINRAPIQIRNELPRQSHHFILPAPYPSRPLYYKNDSARPIARYPAPQSWLGYADPHRPNVAPTQAPQQAPPSRYYLHQGVNYGPWRK